MAITVKHSKVSLIPDAGDASLVEPSDWNADHVLTGTVPVTNGGTGASDATTARTNLGAAASGANSDITSLTGITGAITSPDYIQFDTTYSTALTAGQLGWDGNNTLALGMFGGNVTQHIGEDSYIYYKATSAVTKGQVVMFTGAVGASGVPTGAPATGVTDGTYIMGVAAESVALNGFGLVQTFGELRNVNTTGYVDGDILWYNPSVTGGLTNTKPSAPNVKVQVAAVINGGSSGGGTILIRVDPGSQLGGTDSNVQITSPTTGQSLVYDSGTGIWANSNANVVIGGSVNNSPIGATTASTGKFTTLESTGTASLGTASAQYIQAIGDATYPQVKAAGSGTNIPLVLQPKGTGALQAQLTDSTTTGGNARGQNAVDWQTFRGGASNVASGAFSVIGGGISNISSNYASVVSGGNGNQSTNFYSGALCGNGNIATGWTSVITGGQSNSAAGYFNFIGGGFTNSGTAAAAVTTQATTSVTSGSTAVTLTGSNANIKVGQLITGTGIANDTYVSAISGTSLTLSKNASGTGTPTLSFFTPHGVVVGGGNNQATGSYSFIGGGGDAGTASGRNTASGDWSAVLGGITNSASGNYSVSLGGANNGASSSYAVCLGGSGNGASAFGAVVLGGNGNTANGTYSIAGGFQATNRSAATFAFASGGTTVQGDAQARLFVLKSATTDATATAMVTNTSAAGATNQVNLPNNSAFYFEGEVVAGVTGAGNTKGWKISGVIKRGATAGSTALVGTPTVTSSFADAGAAAWTIAVTADTTNGCLRVTFTGAAATTIRTVAQIRTTEMTY